MAAAKAAEAAAEQNVAGDGAVHRPWAALRTSIKAMALIPVLASPGGGAPLGGPPRDIP